MTARPVQQERWRVIHGDALASLKALPDGCVRCCVTSPPYWGLRDYGVSGQLGLEATPEAYVASMVAVFREVRRVLTDDGTLWLNLGDSYAAHPGQRKETDAAGEKQMTKRGSTGSPSRHVEGIKAKDLVGVPWLVAFALRADGWYLRSDIIWSKPNPMPESVTDRPTKAHEYVFLLSKRERYFYDAAAVAEPVVKGDAGSTFTEGKTGTNGNGRQQSAEARADKQRALGKRTYAGFNDRWDASNGDERATRNARSVWSIATQPYPEAHFATFPPKLAERCILAGSAVGDLILDPFTGSGTTGAVALNHQRRFVGIELNPAYIALAEKRIADAAAQGSLFGDGAP